VLARDAELADAASTALMVAGPARFREVCSMLGIRDALLVTTTGKLLTTPGMAIRLRRDNDGNLPVPVL
jgi:FAD:protein FMN transferase